MLNYAPAKHLVTMNRELKGVLTMLNYAPAKHLVTMNRELKQATFPSRTTGRSNHAELRP